MFVKFCPSCKSAAAETHAYVSGFGTELNGQLFIQEPYAIIDCPTCKLLYKTHTLSPSEFIRYYDQTDFRKWEIAGFYPPERKVLNRLSEFPECSRILDYGCSSGRLLAPLVGRHTCFGCEINDIAAREAAAKGIKIVTTKELEDESIPKYDVIVMSDVFEHLSSPVETLSTLVRCLKAEGELIVATGNGDSKACRLEPAEFWYFRNVEHIAMLTKDNAEWLANRLQLELVAWLPTSHYDFKFPESLKQAARHHCYWLFQRGARTTKTVLRQLPVINRAEHWQMAPPFYYSADHVVAIFKRTAAPLS